MSSASTSVHHVASRSASGSDRRRPGGPWPARGPSRSTRSRSRRTGRASPRRTAKSRHRPVDRRDRGRRARDGSSARPGPRCAGVGRRARGVRPGSTPAGHPARSASRSRACWRSSGRSRPWPCRTAGRCPGVAPWIEGEAQGVGAGLVDDLERIDRRCPSSWTSSGRTGRGSGPTGRPCGTASRRSARCPSIIIRATQKKMMS